MEDNSHERAFSAIKKGPGKNEKDPYKKAFLNVKKKYNQNRLDRNKNLSKLLLNIISIKKNNNDNHDNKNYKLNLLNINQIHQFKEEADPLNGSAIPETVYKGLCNSIFRIELSSKRGTGFFMKIKLNGIERRFLFTCFHVISDKDIENKIPINIYYGPKDDESHIIIDLNKYKRFMKAYKTINEDVTLIEIVKEDGISEDKYLIPDLNYSYGYERYKDKNFFLGGYPKNYNERCISSGRIIEISEYKFIHKLYTKSGSSGSPLVNDYLEVIGIHHLGFEFLHQNEGVFIGKILDNLKGSPAFSNIFRYINLNYHLNDNNNINNNYKNLNRISNNFIKKDNSNDNFSFIDLDNKIINAASYIKYKNFINGEIFIKEKQVNEIVKIINSNKDNKKDIEENCLIKIDGRDISFSYYKIFNKSGKYKITYSFKKYLTNTKCLFKNCVSLTSLDLSNFDITKVTDMSKMFYRCELLTSLDLSNFYTKNVIDMSYMFVGCKSLISLNLTNFRTTNVNDMSWMFRDCKSLKNLDLSNFNIENVTCAGGMFDGCNFLPNLSHNEIYKIDKGIKNIPMEDFQLVDIKIE